MKPTSALPMLQAIAAAMLFGVSAPLAKVLVGQMDPVMLAACLYLGSGFGLLVWRGIRPRTAEARLARGDLPWLLGAVTAGGVAAPVILMYSLRATPAATASLLLNFESVATLLIAALVFREAIGRHAGLAVAAIALGGIVLSTVAGSTGHARGEWGLSLGALGVIAACALWGLDNNLTRNVSDKDPVRIAAIKGLGAGSFSLVTAFALGAAAPQPLLILAALALGSASYGLSLVLFILALRGLGAARTGALFGAAPFVGACASVLIFRDRPGPWFFLALSLMVFGVALLLREEHTHSHAHLSLAHEHRHSHDDHHHQHPHPDGEVPPGTVHSHWHRHETVWHVHPHAPDIHHRHEHDSES
jgi:drug/metabolite transporter (DMT)-like permease